MFGAAVGFALSMLYFMRVLGLGAMLAMLGAFIVVLVLVLTMRNVRQIRRFTRENNNAVARLACGEVQGAQDVFWGWAERARVPLVSALARHNVGSTLIRQGKLHHALAVLTDNDRRHEKHLTTIALAPTSAE